MAAKNFCKAIGKKSPYRLHNAVISNIYMPCHKRKKTAGEPAVFCKRTRLGSNQRPSASETDTLPTELRVQESAQGYPKIRLCAKKSLLF